MLGRRRRRQAKIQTASGQRLVFGGYTAYILQCTATNATANLRYDEKNKIKMYHFHILF